jgi:hypothetical protein
MSAVMSRRVSFGMGRGEPGHVKAPKYKAKPTTRMLDGVEIKFASLKEARVYDALRLLENATRIRNLRLQVTFPIKVEGKLICRYIADFVFEEYTGAGWREVVADAKGYPTPVYKLKRKLMAIVLGIEIREM